MPKAKPEDYARLHFLKGKKAFQSGDLDEALKELNKAFPYYQKTNEFPILAEIQRMLGQIFFDKGMMIESRNNYKRAFQAFKRFGNKIGMADCYDQIAISFMLQEELVHAENYQLKAVKIRRQTPDKKGLARGLKNLAVIQYRISADGEKALELLDEAFELAKRTKDPQLIANISLDQAKISSKLEKHEKALLAMITARRIEKEYSIILPEENDKDFGELLLTVGLKRYDEGDIENALKYLKNAALILKTIDSPLLEMVESTIGKIEKAMDN